MCGAHVHRWRYQSPQFSHLRSSVFAHLVSGDKGTTVNSQLLAQTRTFFSFFKNLMFLKILGYSGHLLCQGCTPYHILNQWREYSQASDLCELTCSCAKLKNKTTYILNQAFFGNTKYLCMCLSSTHIELRGWSGMPCVWCVQWGKAGNCFPWENHRCWGQGAQKRYKRGRGIQTSPACAHTH